MTDWVTVSALASAGSTVVLAGVTLSSVRSASRAASAAERSVSIGMRPVLTSSRLDDRDEKVMWLDEHGIKLSGGRAHAQIVNGNLYLAISVRNVGSGLAVLHGWHAYPSRLLASVPHADVPDFRRQTRDLYIPAGDVGYWQAAIRESDDPLYEPLCTVVKDQTAFTVDLLYSDHEGGQRIVSRFSVRPRVETGEWLSSVGRHWNIDRPDPR
jgi:hypothetical protein